MRFTPYQALLVASAGVVVAGCAAPGGSWVTPRTSQRVESQPMLVGQSVEGAPIEAEMFGGGSEVVLFIGGIHGSEPAGTPLLHRLGEHLRATPAAACGRRVLILPMANPDGAARRQRGNARGVDINRNFSADRSRATLDFEPSRRHGDRPFSEPETRAIRELILQYTPVRIIAMHQPANCVDFDGPRHVQALARAMADAGGLPLRKMGTRAGSLGGYAGETLGIEVITVELPGSASSLDAAALWDQYGKMLLTAICWPEK